LSVTRDDAGFEEEFELFMQLSGTYFGWLIARPAMLPYAANIITP